MMTSSISSGIGNNQQIFTLVKDGYLRTVQNDVNDNGRLDGSVIDSFTNSFGQNGNNLVQQSGSQDNIAIGGRDVSGTGMNASNTGGVVNPRSSSSSSRPASQQQTGPADMMQMLMPLMMMMFQMMMQMFQGSLGPNSLMSQQGSGLAGNTGSAISSRNMGSSVTGGTSTSRPPVQFLA